MFKTNENCLSLPLCYKRVFTVCTVLLLPNNFLKALIVCIILKPV